MSTSSFPYNFLYVSKLPNLLIIGAMKAGTSSLHDYLSHHPDVFMSKQKELDFFCSILNYNNGIEWYKQNFKTDAIIRGETSPNYSKWINSIPLIKYHLGDYVKFIYILRNPLKRFLSHCNYNQIDPNKLVNDPNLIQKEIYINGLYFNRLQKISKEYNINKHLLLITLEELTNHKQKTLRQVFDFLEVDPNKYPWNIDNYKLHVTAEKKIPSKTAIKFANSNWFSILKKTVKNMPLSNYLKKYYHGFLYKKRSIYSLTKETEGKLYSLYEADMNYLNKYYGINYTK